jgi:uncharacterized Tic20 family protein
VSGAQTQGLTFPLRSGESCALSGETLFVGQRQIALREIVSAGLVADTSITVPLGMPPTPGVSLRLSDGSVVSFTPVEQLDCWRLLQALYATRPELAAPLPPPPGATAYGPPPGYVGGPAYGPGPGYGYGYGPPYGPGFGMAGPSESDKTLAGICHLSVFFAPVILPLIIWLAMRSSHPYASSQAKQAFWFHFIFSMIAVVGGIGFYIYTMSSVFTLASSGAPPDPTTVDLTLFPIMLGMYGLLAIVGLIDMIFSVIGAVKAFQGKPFHYPLLGWLRP